MDSGHSIKPYLKIGQDSLTLFGTTVALGTTGYFGGKTLVYMGGGLKNLGSQFLNTQFGSAVGKIVSFPFKQIWYALCWAGRGAKSLLHWGFSCIRHPIESFKNTLNRIRNIISFVFSWTILLVYQKTTSFVNHYLPSIRPPLIAATIAVTIASAASFLPHHDLYGRLELAPTLIKTVAIFAGVLVAAPYLSQKLTTASVSRLEAGGWGATNALLFFALNTADIIEDPND